MLTAGYDIAKAAQAVAYFALKAGGKINVLKLAKLLYLAEREFMRRYDEPMFYDRLVSMPDGPVTSITLNLINGNLEHQTWQRFVAPRSGYDVAPAANVDPAQLEDLSIADREVLDDLWAKFGRYDKYALRDWTHKKENVPEWEDPEGSSSPIPHSKVFALLGKSDPDALSKDVDEYRQLSEALAKSA